MKTHKITLVVLAIFCLTNFYAQESKISLQNGGEVILNPNKEACLSDAHRAAIQNKLLENKQQLALKGILQPINKMGGHPNFIWPVEKAAGVDYESIWAISNYVDQNANFPNQLSDYDCGTRTYDTSSGYNHQGIDVYTWPFWWYQMDNEESYVVSGAPGQILGKDDGNYDRSCDLNSNMWNAIYIQHDDGSIAWYGHLKNGSLTTKNIGETVAAGEYLGVIGSSGNSTGPHLHMEVYDNANNLIDPFTGSCNNMNSDSWWQNQKPYYNPYINKIATHSEPPEFLPCPITEVPHFKDDFGIGEPIYLAIYLRDQQPGTQTTLTLRQPNNSIIDTWTLTFNDYFSASYWYWTFTAPSGYDGQWTFEVTYNDQTVAHQFTIGALSTEENLLAPTKIYPNPVYNTLHIASETPVVRASINDFLGREVIVKEQQNVAIQQLEVSGLSKGIYFVQLVAENNTKKTIKFLKD